MLNQIQPSLSIRGPLVPRALAYKSHSQSSVILGGKTLRLLRANCTFNEKKSMCEWTHAVQTRDVQGQPYSHTGSFVPPDIPAGSGPASLPVGWLKCCVPVSPCLLSSPGCASENPHAITVSPFKAFSPQPPKFFKPLMPVKEEHKKRIALEARPLLSQEVNA